MKKFLFPFAMLLSLLPTIVNAADDKVNINGLYFDLFDWYGTGTCRFTANFGTSGMQSTYILDENPSPFNLDVADLNGDGMVTVADAIMAIDIILNNQ